MLNPKLAVELRHQETTYSAGIPFRPFPLPLSGAVLFLMIGHHHLGPARIGNSRRWQLPQAAARERQFQTFHWNTSLHAGRAIIYGVTFPHHIAFFIHQGDFAMNASELAAEQARRIRRALYPGTNYLGPLGWTAWVKLAFRLMIRSTSKHKRLTTPHSWQTQPRQHAWYQRGLRRIGSQKAAPSRCRACRTRREVAKAWQAQAVPETEVSTRQTRTYRGTRPGWREHFGLQMIQPFDSLSTCWEIVGRINTGPYGSLQRGTLKARQSFSRKPILRRVYIVSTVILILSQPSQAAGDQNLSIRPA